MTTYEPTKNNPFPIPFVKIKNESTEIIAETGSQHVINLTSQFNEQVNNPNLVSIKTEQFNDIAVVASMLADKVEQLVKETDQLKTEKEDKLEYISRLEEKLREASQKLDDERKANEKSLSEVNASLEEEKREKEEYEGKFKKNLEIAEKLIVKRDDINKELDEKLHEIDSLKEKISILKKRLSQPNPKDDQKISSYKRVNYF